MSVARKVIRVLADASKFGKTLKNELTKKKIEFVEANSLEFQIGLTNFGQPLDLANTSTLRLLISELEDDTNLLEKEVGTFDYDTFTIEEWLAGTHQHATILVSAREANITPGEYYLSLQIDSVATPPDVLDLAKSRFIINNSAFQKYWLRPPIFNDVTFTYAENQAVNAVLGTLSATDNTAGPVVFTFENDSATSADGFLFINSSNEVTLTTSGAAPTPSPLNNFENGSNTNTYTIKATDEDGNVTTKTLTLIVTDVDEIAPTISAQSFNYEENIEDSTILLATVAASDNVGVTIFRFAATNTQTSDDGFFQINDSGEIRLTSAGVLGDANDADSGTTSFVHSVSAIDAQGNSASANITLTVTNEASASGTITAIASGYYDETFVWPGGTIPINGQSVIIPDAIEVKVRDRRKVGASPAQDVGTPAIQIQSGGRLLLEDGADLICRGDLNFETTGSNVIIPFEQQAGSSFRFDDREAAGSQVYRFMTPGQYSYRSEPKTIIRGTMTNKAILGVVNGSTWAKITRQGSGNYGGLMDVEHCNFNKLGNESEPFVAPSLKDDCVFRMVNCRMDNCGEVQMIRDNGTAQIDYLNNTQINSAVTINPDGTTERCAYFTSFSGNSGTGYFKVNGNVFDRIMRFSAPSNFEIDDNIFLEGRENGAATQGNLEWNSFKRNIIVLPGETAKHNGSFSDNYYIDTDPDRINIHFRGVDFENATENKTITDTGNIYESIGSDFQGESLNISNPPNGVVFTYHIHGNILCKGGSESVFGSLFALTQDNNVKIYATHNSGWVAAQSFINISEVPDGWVYEGDLPLIEAIKSNVAIAFAATPAYLVQDIGNNNPHTDIVLSSGITHNCRFGTLDGNNGGGCNDLEFSSGTPGANEITEDPQCRNPRVKMQDWSVSLGGEPTHEYALAQLAKKNDPDWDPRWNLADLQAFIRDGWTPQNPNLANAGHDGQTVGAVETDGTLITV